MTRNQELLRPNCSSARLNQERTQALWAGSLLPFTVTNPVNNRKASKETDPRGTRVPPERFRFPEIARNTPESQIWASGPVTTFVSRFTHRVRVPFRRSRSKPILCHKTESSPRKVPAGEGPVKKGVKNFFTRRGSTLWRQSSS
jgi:hypothetical protein